MCLVGSQLCAVQAAQKPNVVFVITDDQGYGDLACNGNTIVQTPNIDKLAKESIRLENYHVDTTCAPTRSALMTGRYSNRVGVWHTVQGRNMLRTRETTMAEIFQRNGYETGIFGKWHLGDVFPYRPEDNGFSTTVYHSGGGVGQTPDYWGNDYFDDTYVKNGKLTKFDGFCTDIFFDEGMDFIKKSVESKKPFFAYIAPNAPHGPYYCPQNYADLYEGKPGVPVVGFYGMITHIDDKVAQLRETLEELNVADNTIFVFTTDNGTAGGMWGKNGFNAGMRGTKGSQYDGGHRVPFFMHWPNGGLVEEKKIDNLTAHLDVLPTFIDLCELSAPNLEFDGKSIRELLYTDGKNWPKRSIVVETQRIVDPVKWRNSAVMTDEWRLINGKELYEIRKDVGQKNDVAKNHPEIVSTLRKDYETFWDSVSRDHDLTSYISIGADESPIVMLTSHDWLVEGIPWNQAQIMHGKFAKEAHWAIEILQDGIYEISLRRWPAEANKAINDSNGYKGFDFKKAVLRIDDFEETKPIQQNDKEITFKVALKKGIAKLSPLFIGENEVSTPYYAYITHKPFKNWQTAAGMKIPEFDPNSGAKPPQPLQQDTMK